VRLNDLTAHRQAKARPANGAMGQALDAEELVEDSLQRLSRNPHAAVGNADFDLAADDPRGQPYRPARGGVFARVREQVRKHLLDPIWLGHGRRQVFWQIQHDRVFGVVSRHLGGEAQQGGHVRFA
jgi:hypothetical protein